MSLRDYFYYGLEFHDQPVNRLMGVVHTHYLGTCYSRVYEYDLDDLNSESEVPYELAKESIIEEILADLVSYMDVEENYYIVDEKTHAMRIISLSKAESDNAGESLPKEYYEEDGYYDGPLDGHGLDYGEDLESMYATDLVNLELTEDELSYYFEGGAE